MQTLVSAGNTYFSGSEEISLVIKEHATHAHSERWFRYVFNSPSLWPFLIGTSYESIALLRLLLSSSPYLTAKLFGKGVSAHYDYLLFAAHASAHYLLASGTTAVCSKCPC